MTIKEVDALKNPEVAQFVERHINEKPAKLALKYASSDKYNGFPLTLVSSQLKYLQKSRNKLPLYYSKRCIIPARAYEQCSGEKAAALKDFAGKNCLDLTMGLGVDSLYLAQNFEQVTALETDEVLCEVNKHNFGLFEIKNINIQGKSAKEYLQNYTGSQFDLIYVDPDRRAESGQRLYALKDCSPNITELLPLIKQHSKQLWIKLSPLYDLAEGFRQFPQLRRAIVVSTDGECKEVILDLDFSENKNNPTIDIWISRNNENFRYNFSPQKIKETQIDLLQKEEKYSFLYEADVAFYKARCAHTFFDGLAISGKMNHPMAYFFSDEYLSIPGRTFEIIEVLPFKPAALRKRFKKTRLNISSRNFPIKVAKIRKLTRIAEGGEQHLICTEMAGKKVAILCRAAVGDH